MKLEILVNGVIYHAEIFSFLFLLQEVPPLDVPELLAYFVRQSGPFLDQLGVKKGKQIFSFC